ncbi:hypothetical protein [Enterobacter sp. Bisph1]|uniref:hypothetical protein n=1 Tax=Enterobacter sp. Bisph1 TaxID=1274399 RepID=UPI0012E086A4|nr:hypothetical protein [Enterobacter sp. Bisph1]
MLTYKVKVANAGFSKQELLGFKRQYGQLKATYHPNLTVGMTLPALIKEEARKSIIMTRYYIVAIFLFTFAAAMFGNWSYMYMPAGMLFFALLDVRSSAIEGERTIVCQIKLMILAVKLWF